MIATLSTLALAAALQQPGDVYTDDQGCRWKRRPVAASAAPKKSALRPATVAASKPARPRPAKAKPADPGDDFIGCDPEGFGIWRSDLETTETPLELVPPVKLERLPSQPEPATLAPATPGDPGPTFAEGTIAAPPSWPVYGGGGYFVPVRLPPTAPATPIPEPSIWLGMLAAGLLVIARAREARR